MKPASTKGKRRITVASAKARGRNLQNWLAEKISVLLGIPWGKDELIASREGSQPGTDIRLLGEARERHPFSWECKNCEKWHLPEWIEQAKANQMAGTSWAILAKRNRHDPVVVVDAETFFSMLEEIKWGCAGPVR